MRGAFLRRLAFGLASVLAISTAVSTDQLREQRDGLSLSLKRVYAYETAKGWTGNLNAFLGPEGRYLFVVETSKQEVRVKKVDWQNGRTEKEKTFPNSAACEWAMIWGWIPHTSLTYLRSCGVHYILDAGTLEIERKMLGSKWGDGFTFSPTGQTVLVSEYDEQQKRFRRALYELPSWTEIAPWNSPGQGEVFTQDGKYVIARLIREEEGRPQVAECGLAFYEVPTGKVASRWLVDPRQRGDENHCWDAGAPIPNAPYLVVNRMLGKSLVVVDLWSGKVLKHFEPTDVKIATNPVVSPDGRLVVVGGWDDPQDQEWSRDFVVWSLQTRQIVYRTPKYRSVWGRNTSGRQVYPGFSYDGKYLIVVKESSVEFWYIEQRTVTN